MSGSAARWEALDAVLRDHERFVLSTHVNPDGDGLGSEVALGLWLRGLGKDVTILNDGRMPSNFDFLARHITIETFSEARAEEVFARAQVLVVVDMQNRDRLGRIAPYAARPGLKVVVLDHHVGDAAFGQVNVVEPEKAATGELLYDFMKRTPERITPPIAEALYAALVTDTGSFRHSNTDQDAHLMAAHLTAIGVETALVQSYIHQHRNMDRLRFLGHLLMDLRTSPDGRVAWFEVPQDLFGRYEMESSDTEGLVDFPRNVPGVEVVMLLTELPERKVKVSLRSSGRVDVNAVAVALGGGGHRFAAGATVPGTLPEARELLLGRVTAAVAAVDPNARRYAEPAGRMRG
jgi:phosphoesterase RecJ-like protein